MPAYITYDRFRKMGFGIDMSELDPATWASLAAQATTWVNNYCLVPRMPQQHDFRGGTITGEQHSWRYPESDFDIGQRRAYPFHWPVKRMSQFRIYVTNTQYVQVDTTGLFINSSQRYVEVVSLALTSAGLFNALVVPNIGLATPVVRFSYEYGWDFTEPGETLQTEDGQTWAATNQWWYADQDGEDAWGVPIGGAPVISKNGAVITTGFTINYDEGTVVFDANLEATDVVSAAYHYKLPNEISLAAGHIMAWLFGASETRSRGMTQLESLQIGEVKLTKPIIRSVPSGARASDLELLVPDAAALLATYRFDGVSVR
jgi:hypothetical protein